jgi:hypothetical protein
VVIVTSAPLTTAPEGSLTVPTMLPVPTVVWANKQCVTLNRAKSAHSETARIRASLATVVTICHPLKPNASEARTRYLVMTVLLAASS